MNRRNFIFKTSGVLFSALLLPGGIRAATPGNLDRIGITTVLFRYRFQQTKPDGVEQIQNELTVPDVPKFYSDRFGVKNVELWSYHFESLEESYLQQLKDNLEASGSTLINIQLDGPYHYNLASSNEEERQRGLQYARDWIDAAAFLGSTSIRINPGRGGPGAVDTSIRSLREVNEYARERDLILLTENHFGIEMDPDVHLRINREAGPENIYTLPDFGNYPDDERMENLRKILPHAYLISAKGREFNEDYEHISYDYAACVRLAEELGFKGIYSIEQWSPWRPEHADYDFEKITDNLIGIVRDNLRT